MLKFEKIFHKQYSLFEIITKIEIKNLPLAIFGTSFAAQVKVADVKIKFYVTPCFFIVTNPSECQFVPFYLGK